MKKEKLWRCPKKCTRCYHSKKHEHDEACDFDGCVTTGEVGFTCLPIPGKKKVGKSGREER
jgi:hypothetical protein